MNKTRTILFDDVFFQFAPRNSGVARIWTDLLTSREFQTALSDNFLELIILSRSGELDYLTPFKSIPFPKLNHGLWALDCEQLDLVCESLGAHLFVSTYFTFPTNTHTWMWCYDLIPERLGNQSSIYYSPGWQQRQFALLKCQNFVSISKSTRSDLNHYYPHSNTEFGAAVAYPWLSSAFRESHSRVKRIFQTSIAADSKRLVMIGSRHQLEGYKNGALVLKAIETGALDDFQIVFVGGEQLSDQEKSLANTRGIRLERVDVDDYALVKLLLSATALIYPSKYEGFGLPVIEALSCGTPVICQHSTSLPEAGGDCAVYIKDDSVKSLVDAIELTQNRFVRKSVKDRGPTHALSFSRDKSIEVLVASLHSAVQSGDTQTSAINQDFDLSGAVKLLAKCQI